GKAQTLHIQDQGQRWPPRRALRIRQRIRREAARREERRKVQEAWGLHRPDGDRGAVRRGSAAAAGVAYQDFHRYADGTERPRTGGEEDHRSVRDQGLSPASEARRNRPADEALRVRGIVEGAVRAIGQARAKGR